MKTLCWQPSGARQPLRLSHSLCNKMSFFFLYCIHCIYCIHCVYILYIRIIYINCKHCELTEKSQNSKHEYSHLYQHLRHLFQKHPFGAVAKPVLRPGWKSLAAISQSINQSVLIITQQSVWADKNLNWCLIL